MKFTVRPRPHSRLHFNVHVFGSRRQMYQYGRLQMPQVKADYAALTIVHFADPRLIGELLFTVQQLTPELIAHEASHAAEHYARTVGRRDGETIAAATAKITSDILDKVNHA